MYFPLRRFVLFALLSAADLSLTWHLLQSRGTAYEANPVARRVLDGHGWVGLVAFKAGCVVLVGAACLAVGRRRPRAARRVLALGCATLAGVVLYSGWLATSAAGREADEVAVLAEKARRLDRQMEAARAHRVLFDRLSEALAGGRCTLAEAVVELEESGHGRDRAWLSQLREVYGCRSDRACLAACLIRHAVSRPGQTPRAARGAAGRLASAFEQDHGVPVPRLCAWPPADVKDTAPATHTPVPPRPGWTF